LCRGGLVTQPSLECGGHDLFGVGQSQALVCDFGSQCGDQVGHDSAGQ
jgi:hypothetical protein